MLSEHDSSKVNIAAIKQTCGPQWAFFCKTLTKKIIKHGQWLWDTATFVNAAGYQVSKI